MLKLSYTKEEYDPIKATNPSADNKDWKSWGESVTDVKQFQPTAQMVKSMTADGGNGTQGVYDFEDGIDDGRPIPPTRKPGIDLAEASRAEREFAYKETEERAENTKKISEYQEAQKNAIEAQQKALRAELKAEIAREQGA